MKQPKKQRKASAVTLLDAPREAVYEAAVQAAEQTLSEWIREACEVRLGYSPELSPGAREALEAGLRSAMERPAVSLGSFAQPLPPEVLAGALQDRVHSESGKLLAAKPVKPWRYPANVPDPYRE